MVTWKSSSSTLMPWTATDFARVFFVQAEDGIRDLTVTGVQTCALPISLVLMRLEQAREKHRPVTDSNRALERGQLLALQVRKRRDEVEVPVSAGHRCSSARRWPPRIVHGAASARRRARGALRWTVRSSRRSRRACGSSRHTIPWADRSRRRWCRATQSALYRAPSRSLDPHACGYRRRRPWILGVQRTGNARDRSPAEKIGDELAGDA